MRYFKGLFIGMVAALTLIAAVPQAQAFTPQYSAYMESNNSVRITISNADPYGQINFYARQGGTLSTSITNLGYTDQFGYFSGTINPGLSSSQGQIDTYVTVNNQQSTVVVLNSSGNYCNYPYSSIYCDNTLTASQTSVNLNSGSQTTVTFYTNYNQSYYQSLYINSQPNSSVATASLSNNILTIYGNNSGYTSVQVCLSNNQSRCVTVQITVSGFTGGNGFISFSSNDLSLNVGQSASVTAYLASPVYPVSGSFPLQNNFYISNNSNPSVAYANVSNNNILVYGTNPGSTTFTVCAQYYASTCNTLRVRVGGVLGGTTYANGTLLSENGTIYTVYKNSKIGFTNWSAFVGLGYQLSNVTNTSFSNIPTSGIVVSHSQQAHPWGTWVKSGNTVYFVDQSGLIPITSYDIFLNNGGQDRLVVPMNSYDWQLPMLQVMVYNDVRLR